MIKRVLLCLLCCCATLTNLYSQEIDKLFAVIPNQLLPYLDGAWRKDLVDLYKKGKEATLQNKMNGQSTLKNLTEDYLFLQSTSNSTLELKLIPLVNNTKLICMVKTVYAPVADSRLYFFSTDWKAIDTDEMFTPPTQKDFIKKTDSELLNRLDIDFFTYSLNEKDLTLTIKYASPDYLDEEARKQIQSLLKKDSIVQKWNKHRFK